MYVRFNQLRTCLHNTYKLWSKIELQNEYDYDNQQMLFIWKGSFRGAGDMKAK